MKLGDTIRGREIGMEYNDYFIWIVCPDCKKERWVRKSHLKRARFTGRCSSCNVKVLATAERPIGEKHHRWNGGRVVTSVGYVYVLLNSDDFFFPMVKKGRRVGGGYIPEHRLVMAKHLGRCLQDWEKVHHKGIRYIGIENKSDNLIDNLELTTAGSHSRAHSKGYRDGYQKGLRDGQDARIKEVREKARKQFGEILRWWLDSSLSDEELATAFGISAYDWQKLFCEKKANWNSYIGSLVDECEYPLCKVRQELQSQLEDRG